MKLVLGAAAAVMFLAGAAFAQTDTTTASAAPAAAAQSQCPALAAEPTLPDGATANNRAMMAADQAYQGWATTARTTLECRRNEVTELQTRLQALLAEHNASVQRVNTFTQSWEATRTAFCARPGINCTDSSRH